MPNLTTVILEECKNGRRKLALKRTRLRFSDLAAEKFCLSLVPENIKTLCLITRSSDLNAYHAKGVGGSEMATLALLSETADS